MSRLPGARWRGRKVLITTGPTREHLDPIRFLTNGSTGTMGFALAREACRRGADVTVVCGPVASPRLPGRVRVVPVVSALDMRREVLRRCVGADVLIAAAAVGDWRFAEASPSKIKKSEAPMKLTLLPNPDIIAEASRRVGGLGRRPAGGRRPVLVGFALETSDMLRRALRKLRSKGLDLIVANGPESMGTGRARLALLAKDGSAARLPRMAKRDAARMILDRIAGLP